MFQATFGARPFAMGQAYTALGDDAFGLAFNPASLSRMRESQVATQFTQSIADTQLGYLSFATPLNPTQAIGLGIAYLDVGKAEIFDASGNQTATLNAERDFLAQLGYSHSFKLGSGLARDESIDSRTVDARRLSIRENNPSDWGRIHLGVSGKILKSTLFDQSQASAYAGDLGALYETRWAGGVASLGIAEANIGPGIRYSGGLAGGAAADPLPLTTRVGLGYVRDAFISDTVSAGLEADRVAYDNTLFESVGLEYIYHGICAVRLGYRIGQDVGNFSMGVGIKIKSISVDYGLALAQALNNIQQFSLQYRFNIPGIRYSNAPPTPLEKLVESARKRISEGRDFDAWAEVERIDVFFPGSEDAARLKQELDRAVDADVSAGQNSSRYFYAEGFSAYQRTQWAEAIKNLDISLARDPGNKEAIAYLARSRKKLEQQQRQQKLEKEARTGILFDLANQAFEEKDFARSIQIINEILRLGPYRPAEGLKKRIEQEGRNSKLSAPKSAPPAQPASVPPPKGPTESEIAKADDLFKGAMRAYSDGNLSDALALLREGRRLNPGSTLIRNFHESVEKELKQKAVNRP